MIGTIGYNNHTKRYWYTIVHDNREIASGDNMTRQEIESVKQMTTLVTWTERNE